MSQRLIAGPGLIRRNYFIYTYYILILKPFNDVLDGKNSFKNIYSIKNLFNRLKNTCPLKNQCQTSNLIYRGDFENKVKDERNAYFGLAATTFKERFENHKKDFNHKQHSKITELSKYIWSLKDAKIPYSIKWSIVQKVYGKKNDHCLLCLAEKLYLIEYSDEIRLLNKRSEFINHCRHQNKLLLKSLKRNDSMN